MGTVLTGDTPSLIADLRSVETDLRYAARLFVRVAELDPDADADARQALYDAGVIAYRRGFTGGRSLVTKGQSRTKFRMRSSTHSIPKVGKRTSGCLSGRIRTSLIV